MTDKEFLAQSMKTLQEVPDELVDDLYSLCKIREFKKGELLLRAGDIPQHMGFNLNGIFRLYYLDENGNDFTKGFSIPGRFLVSYSAIAQNRASYFSMESLNDCRILQFLFQPWMEMAEKDIRWYPFLFKLMESVYFMKEIREMSLLTEDAPTRYNRFRMEYPGLEEQIPQYLVASFIGITPEALSRIKKKRS